ncbi:sugar phosphate isomerase/epimerase family protein [Streptomyces griseorubiginosus]|uniref:sugar phosphate isomerase/epimerase family protein n=1 Tax=Streptomyces griseorubiginosus TaxID=67304 RepID=UPI002E819ED2|nr:sugar phosphate isomerase/epimerase family protein [Streptomyces griseorubiginosus]WUB46912.1 sugar phosphate isomerase/epimerase [Streptomyces griseorubiginosus]WUB55434.1 sugar phosphate isomerase/epimerase [Streptomyces griseorubiginosus]
MKLAFSTLGVPGLPLADVLRLATTYGYHGVELRAHPEEPVHPGVGLAERADAVAEFKAAGVEVLGLAGYARVAAPGDDEPVVEEIHRLLDLARDLGAGFVRVFPGAASDQSPEDADATAARRLGTAAEYAGDLGVRILLETHDSHRTGADAIRILGPVGHRQVGSLWDVMHTWLGGEQPSETYAALAPHLGYVQVKDIASAEDTTPVALGAGVLPLAECVEILSRHGWDGWLCWEYEKRWYEKAAPLEELLGAGREHLARLLNDAA